MDSPTMSRRFPGRVWKERGFSRGRLFRLFGLCCLILLEVAGIRFSQAASPPGSMEEFSKRWPNGPFQQNSPFPIAVWLQDPRNAPQYKAIGINLYIGLWKGPTESQLAELRRHQMPVICFQNEYALAHLDEKLFVGWMHEDEPDNAQPIPGGKGYGPPIPPAKIIEAYEQMRRRDPSRPVLLNLGQGVAWDGWHGRGTRTNHPEDYPEYVRGGDIVSFDIYPVVHPKPAVAGKLWYVARGVQRLRQWAGPERIVWNCIESSRISNPQTKPTPQQVKAEVWMSLIYGSEGIVYFCHQFKPQFVESALLADHEMAQAVAAINRQIQDLASVLRSLPKPECLQVTAKPAEVDAEMSALLGPVGIAATVRVYEDRLYIFAVRMLPTKAEGQFQLAQLPRALPPAATACVLGENRTVPVQKGMLTDRFGPYEVHLYEIPLTPEEKANSSHPQPTEPENKGVQSPGQTARAKVALEGEEKSALPRIEYFPEMTYGGADGWLPEREWTQAQKTQSVQAQQEVQQQWQKLAPRLAQQITPEKVRELSRWAQKEMAQYQRIPPLDQVVFEPVGLSEEGRHIVLEGTIDTLPSHHRLVTRWLKVYVHYELEEKRISRVVFTIRGKREE